MRKLIIAAAICTDLLAPSVWAQPAPADGQVTKVDVAAGKITLKHGPIKNLDMDAMTMVFRVKDAAMLNAVKTGDRVRFEAERVDGAITLTKIEKIR